MNAGLDNYCGATKRRIRRASEPAVWAPVAPSSGDAVRACLGRVFMRFDAPGEGQNNTVVPR